MAVGEGRGGGGQWKRAEEGRTAALLTPSLSDDIARRGGAAAAPCAGAASIEGKLHPPAAQGRGDAADDWTAVDAQRPSEGGSQGQRSAVRRGEMS